MKIKEKIAQNNDYIALLPDGQFKAELEAENKRLERELEYFMKRKAQKTKIERKKSDFLGKGRWIFTFNCWEVELTEEQEDYLKNLGVENYKNNK